MGPRNQPAPCNLLITFRHNLSYSAFVFANQFAPFEDLASRLLLVLDSGGDGAHDHAHLARVWVNAQQIRAQEGGDFEVLAASVLLHDCVQVPKNSPDRNRASYLAAGRARSILHSLNWDRNRVDIVAGAIETHSYSAGLEPQTLEGCILQDADRLDAIGFIGIARCFYTAGRLSSQIFRQGLTSTLTSSAFLKQKQAGTSKSTNCIRVTIRLCGTRDRFGSGCAPPLQTLSRPVYISRLRICKTGTH
jgi:uncharacterized protein